MPNAPKKYVSEASRALLRRRILKLYLAGNSYGEIADKVEVSKATVGRYFKEVMEEVKRDTLEDAEEIRAIELLRLDSIIRANEKIMNDPDARPSEIKGASEVILKTQERRTKYLGLDSDGSNGEITVKFVREG